MDPEKLKFFNSKLRVWDFAKISLPEFQSLSFDDKSLLLKNYYVEVRGKPFFAVAWQFSGCVLTESWLCFG